MDNQRATKIYNVAIYSISLHKYTELGGQPDVIESYAVIASTGKKTDRYSLSYTSGSNGNTSGSNGKTDEIQTTVEYYDETQVTTREDLDTIYDIDIPK
jgi:hypothetical protein